MTELARRLAALADTAEQIMATGQLDEARREMRLARERMDAPERARQAARQALADVRSLRRQVELDRAARTGDLALANIEAQVDFHG